MPSKQVEDVYNAGGFDGGPLGRPETNKVTPASPEVMRAALRRITTTPIASEAQRIAREALGDE
ncbi:hypothetical protein [Roseicitreum antarcticum]|uniref:Uncharacterized protein n=1 Tax=Roseicitreum antarcticum TaxID=564137 RepID=A0A1H2YHD4_9RHOB|nr:hypothetical protein [Roseicitreum antarcticum]SDX04490.1 hypothetical protein SAMN04488238_1057 [Roseicitreum antarcticum]